MSWRMSVGVPILVSLAGVSGAPGMARADDAYLCGPDTVVYVNAADLEAKKHSDPCIAAYYGITLEQPAKPQAALAPEKPVAGSAAKPAAEKVELKSSYVAEVRARARHVQQRDAMLAQPQAALGTDFRNIRVINASAEENQWFRHTR